METSSVDQNLKVPENKPRVVKKSLDKNDFLNLLVSQLKNQDPLNPQSNEDFMSTMAQFNSLETLNSLDSNLQYSRAAALIDKPVTVQEPNKEPVSGKVEKAAVVEGKAVVYVGGKEYKLEEVREITCQDPSQKPSTGTDLIQAALMIGREVLIKSGQDQVAGLVEKVGLDSGLLKVFVNGAPFDIAAITEIRDAGPAPEATAVPAAQAVPAVQTAPAEETPGVDQSEGAPEGTG